MSETTIDEYEDRYVAFIDLLGFKRRLKTLNGIHPSALIWSNC
jgi:hypothetical protein